MPQNQNGRPAATADRAATNNLVIFADRSAARRMRLHHTFVRRRRWSRELDRICGRWAA
jgi:hypothetical protein